MPTLSQFYGITIMMYFNDHLPPHIHVICDGMDSMMDIQTGSLLNGALKPNAKRMVTEWINLHREELEQAWETKQIRKIEPLD